MLSWFMTHEIAVWRLDGNQSTRISPSRIDLEATLESLIENDPDILDEPLLLIGKQVQTSNNTFIDLLGIDVDGVIHVLELKRDATPRRVVAQALESVSWVRTQTIDEIRWIHSRYRPGTALDTAFEDRFGIPPPEDFGIDQRITVVAASIDGDGPDHGVLKRL